MMTTMEAVERVAPQGKWRVIAVNPDTGVDWVIDDCSSQVDAVTRTADEARDDASLAYLVYSDVGECIHAHDALNEEL